MDIETSDARDAACAILVATRFFIVHLFDQPESSKKASHYFCSQYKATSPLVSGTLPEFTRNRVFGCVAGMNPSKRDVVACLGSLALPDQYFYECHETKLSTHKLKEHIGAAAESEQLMIRKSF